MVGDVRDMGILHLLYSPMPTCSSLASKLNLKKEKSKNKLLIKLAPNVMV